MDVNSLVDVRGVASHLTINSWCRSLVTSELQALVVFISTTQHFILCNNKFLFILFILSKSISQVGGVHNLRRKLQFTDWKRLKAIVVNKFFCFPYKTFTRKQVS